MSAPRRTLGLGTISGLRSLSGLAFVCHAASRGRLDLGGTPLAFLSSPRLAKAALVMALGEAGGDKLPMAPSRTSLPPLLGRAASGAVVGAALFTSDGRRAATGAALGSSAAVAAAFTGEQLRSLVAASTRLPEPIVALAEDAAVLFIGLRSLKNVR